MLWSFEIFLSRSEVVGHFMRQFVYTSLLLITTLRFTCGEPKICSIIKKSQTIMNMIIGDEKLSVEHTHVNSKRISKILKWPSLPLFLGPWIRNEKYAIYGNIEIKNIWKKSGYNMYYFIQYPLFIRKIFTRKWASKTQRPQENVKKIASFKYPSCYF